MAENFNIQPMNLNMYLNFAVAMLAIVNPLGIIPLWSALTGDLTQKARRELATMLIIMAVAVLTVFLNTGEEILELFSIKLPVFRIAGGLLLSFTGVSMVNGKIDRRNNIEQERGTTFQVAKSRFRKIIVPIGIPMLSGPGSLTTVVLYGARANEATEYIVLSAILIAVLIMLLFAFYFSDKLEKRIDPIIFDVMTRLLGIIVTAIALQFMIEGLTQVFPVLTKGS